ncbi:surface-adhesin E family protein [Candidatus Nitrospira nitrificans]|uniref:Surface-adhesin protein E-like domain-containing protein n=1 Tax=Candidatus Nitrospira nitrificans TaxID=1742973 RepID=A0A0S4L566_9BACT|nr:surface-adhesin E family protein [Candidatus Nitrospira nitrificans]CUS32335.1 exported hypothetical protein [Candidatus Nitrospira nitrificans]
MKRPGSTRSRLIFPPKTPYVHPIKIHSLMRSMRNKSDSIQCFFLAALLLSGAGPVYAGWVAVEKQYQPAGLETIYIDPDRIQRKGLRATLWQLTNLKWNSTTRFLSLKIHKEFDCDRPRVRVLQVIEFSRQMGTGRSKSGYIENGNWQPIEEADANHALWKAACGKR